MRRGAAIVRRCWRPRRGGRRFRPPTRMRRSSPWVRAGLHRPTTRRSSRPARGWRNACPGKVGTGFRKGHAQDQAIGRAAETIMRSGLRAVGRLLVAALAATFASAAGADEKVRIGLDLTISGYHAGWLVAQKLGYFKEQGLDVTIGRGFG